MAWNPGYKLTTFAIVLTLGICVTAKVDFPNCSAPKEVTNRPRGYDRISNKGLIALYETAFFFVDDIIHNSDLRYMEERGVDFADPDSIVKSFEDDWETWLKYWVGYMVMAAIGIVLILSMTIGGLVTCCCRCCCGNCGAKQRQKRPNDKSLRTCCGISLLIIVTLCFFGGVCVLITSLDLMKKIDSRNTNSVYNNYADAFDGLQNYMSDGLEDINCTSLGSFRATKADVFSILDNVPNDSVQLIDDRIAATATLTTLSRFTSRLTDLETRLVDSTTVTTDLNNNRTFLYTNLTLAKSETILKLQNCNFSDCNQTREKVSQMVIYVNYSSFNYLIATAVTEMLIDAGVDNHVNEGLLEIGEVKNKVGSTMEPSIRDAKDQTEAIDGEIVGFLTDLNDTLLGANLGDISQSLRDLNDDIPGWIWDLVMALLITAGSIFILITLLTYIGLIQGMACSQPNTPEDNCGTTVQAANWLKAAVTLIFIFYWIFMIVCAVVFVAGGIAHNDACRHAVKLNDSAITGILDDIVSQQIQGLGAQASEIYTSCGNNQALYSAVQADKMPGLNITELLDMTELQKMINEIKNINIDIGNIELLDSNAADILNMSGTELNSFKDDLTDHNEELDKEDILSHNVSEIISELEDLNDKHNLNLNAAIDRFKLVRTTEQGMLPLVNDLKNHFSVIEEILNEADLGEAVAAIQRGEQEFNDNGNSEIKQYVNITADDIYDDLAYLMKYIDGRIRQDVALCYPAYDSLLILVDSTCVDIAYPVNGLWLSFGFTLILYIPAIFIMLKLVNLYKAYNHPADNDGSEIDVGFEDDYAKQIRATKKQYDSPMENSTEMAAMTNPIYISDEGMRNGYGNSQAPNGAHVYPGYGSNQNRNARGSLPSVPYSPINGYNNKGYQWQEEVQTTRFREDDELSYNHDYPSRQNLNNDHLTGTYDARHDYPSRQNLNNDHPTRTYNARHDYPSRQNLNNDHPTGTYDARHDYPSRQNLNNDHQNQTYDARRNSNVYDENQDKRNSALRLGVRVFPTPEPPKYDYESPYHLPRPHKATQ